MRLALIDKFEDYLQYLVEHKEELEIVISSTEKHNAFPCDTSLSINSRK